VFVSDVRLPVLEQITDGVTGRYISKKKNAAWQTPERVFLQKPGHLTLDGCTFVQGDNNLLESLHLIVEGNIHLIFPLARDANIPTKHRTEKIMKATFTLSTKGE
jgi:hypothetical protein